jgi:MFS family permease
MKAQHSQSPILELTAIIGTICAFSFIAGFIYPVIALALEARGHDETAIGLNATASGLGILVAGYFIPRLVGRFGTFRVLAFGVALCVVSLMLMPVFSGYWEWVALRIVLAMSVAALFSVGEAWINAIADEETRGRTVAIYVAAMALSFAIGAGTVKLTGFEGMLPFVTASIIVVLCFLPVLPFHASDPLAEPDPLAEKGDVVWTVLKQAAVLMVVVVLFGALDAVILGLFPSYALAQGVPAADAAMPLAAMAIGVVLLQFPLGYLSDRVSRMRLLTVILSAVVILGPIVPLVDLTHWTGLAFVALFGGLAFAPYTLALAVLGERYKGRKLAAGSALFAIMWGLGTTAGPVLFGVAMEHVGSFALPYGLAMLFLATAMITILDRAPSPTGSAMARSRSDRSPV